MTGAMPGLSTGGRERPPPSGTHQSFDYLTTPSIVKSLLTFAIKLPLRKITE